MGYSVGGSRCVLKKSTIDLQYGWACSKIAIWSNFSSAVFMMLCGGDGM